MFYEVTVTFKIQLRIN